MSSLNISFTISNASVSFTLSKHSAVSLGIDLSILSLQSNMKSFCKHRAQNKCTRLSNELSFLFWAGQCQEAFLSLPTWKVSLQLFQMHLIPVVAERRGAGRQISPWLVVFVESQCVKCEWKRTDRMWQGGDEDLLLQLHELLTGGKWPKWAMCHTPTCRLKT